MNRIDPDRTRLINLHINDIDSMFFPYLTMRKETNWGSLIISLNSKPKKKTLLRRRFVWVII
jgi:hypothetical protein